MLQVEEALGQPRGVGSSPGAGRTAYVAAPAAVGAALRHGPRALALEKVELVLDGLRSARTSIGTQCEIEAHDDAQSRNPSDFSASFGSRQKKRPRKLH